MQTRLRPLFQLKRPSWIPHKPLGPQGPPPRPAKPSGGHVPRTGRPARFSQLVEGSVAGRTRRTEPTFLTCRCRAEVTVGLRCNGEVESVRPWAVAVPSLSLPAGLKRDLVLHYGFDKAGERAADTSGKGNHGRVDGAIWTERGRLGGCCSFDAGAVIATEADRKSLSLASACTVAAWIEPARTQRNVAVIRKRRPSKGDLNYRLGFEDGRYVFQRERASDDRDFFARAPMKKEISEWTHLLGVYDLKSQKLYVDGRLAASEPVPRFKPYLGNDPLEVGLSCGGLVDEVMIWCRALSEAEVKQVYELAGGK